MNTMWTNGHMISPIKPELILMPEGHTIMSEGVPDSELANAGWHEIEYDETVFLNRPVDW